MLIKTLFKGENVTMSKILIITPIYKIVGRKELVRDTECVHDLVKYWKKEHNIYVINVYPSGLRKVLRLLKPQQLKYFLNGYNYDCDGIPVTLIEKQNLFIKQKWGYKFNAPKINYIIKKQLQLNNFIPNIIVVHIPSCSNYFVKNLNYNCKKIAVLHYTDVKYLNQKGNKFIKFLQNNYEAVFCRSKFIYEIFKNYKLSNLREEIIYSGVSNIDNRESKPNLKFKQRKVEIIYVGKLIKRKRLDFLIKALCKIDDKLWNLNVIGAGPMQKKYKKLVQKLSLEKNVHFLGTFPKNKVFEYMDKADIFCMPSVKETLGLVYLEAMSRGCITIGTINEGIDGIIQNGYNGYLVESNVEKIYLLIKDIINKNIKEKEEISKNAIKTIQLYNEKDMSERYLKIVMKILNNESGVKYE